MPPVSSLLDEEALELAQRHLTALARRFADVRAGAADAKALAELRELCRQAFVAVRDPLCREQIQLVQQYAAELFSRPRHQKWRSGPRSGSDVLTRNIERCLARLEARMTILGAQR